MSDPVNSGQSNRSIKNLWLNPDYQRRYIFWVTAAGLILVALNVAIFYVFTRENYSILVDLSPMTAEAKTQLYKELWQILGLLIGASALFLVIAAVLGLVFSHRTVGPMYHFKRVFDEIQRGNLSARVRLRPKDDFKDVAAAFNSMMDKIQQK